MSSNLSVIAEDLSENPPQQQQEENGPFSDPSYFHLRLIPAEKLTTLCSVCKEGDLPMVKFFLRNCANFGIISKLDEFGNNALYYIVLHNHQEIMEYFCIYWSYWYTEQLLSFAVELNNLSAVRFLLQHASYEVSPRNLLYQASQFGHIEMIELLFYLNVAQDIDFSLSATFTNNDRNYKETAEALLSHGARFNFRKQLESKALERAVYFMAEHGIAIDLYNQAMWWYTYTCSLQQLLEVEVLDFSKTPLPFPLNCALLSEKLTHDQHLSNQRLFHESGLNFEYLKFGQCNHFHYLTSRVLPEMRTYLLDLEQAGIVLSKDIQAVVGRCQEFDEKVHDEEEEGALSSLFLESDG